MRTERTAATQIICAPSGAEHLVLRRAQLTVVEGPSKGLQHLLDKPRIRIGAGRDCEVRLEDPAVSRYHLALTAGPDGFELKDLASTNGTFVSSTPQGPRERGSRGAACRSTPTEDDAQHRRAEKREEREGQGGALAAERRRDGCESAAAAAADVRGGADAGVVREGVGLADT